jgi:hypothetical protein
MTMKNFYLFLLCGLMCAANVGAQTWDCGANGGNGGNVTATLNNGTLTISGEGAMYNYDNVYAPWYDSRNSITSVIIANGVTSVGLYVFEECSALTSVSIPESVTAIGDYAFYNCAGLASVTIPEAVTTVGNAAFQGCTLQVINAVGAVVYTQNITGHDETIHLHHLPAGAYFFRLEKDGRVKTIKAVKTL